MVRMWRAHAVGEACRAPAVGGRHGGHMRVEGVEGSRVHKVERVEKERRSKRGNKEEKEKKESELVDDLISLAREPTNEKAHTS